MILTDIVAFRTSSLMTGHDAGVEATRELLAAYKIANVELFVTAYVQTFVATTGLLFVASPPTNECLLAAFSLLNEQTTATVSAERSKTVAIYANCM